MRFYQPLAATILCIIAASCQKNAPAVNSGSGSKTTASLIVGLPPAYIWWSTMPTLPYYDGEPGDIPKGIEYPLGFAINGKGYVCGGRVSDSQGSTKWVQNLFEYDLTTRMYTEKSPCPGAESIASSVFVIGDDAYVVNINQLYKYNQPTNTWTKKAPVPGPVTYRFNETSFAVGGKGYFGLGEGETTGGVLANFKDWWEYDPTTDHWTKKSNFPGGTRDLAVGFAVDAFGYVCSGEHFGNTVSYPNDLWQYNPVNDTWHQKANIPWSGVHGGIGLNGTVDGGGHYGFVMATGPGGCFEYNPATDKWGALPDIPGGARYDFTGFMIGLSIFAGGGYGHMDMHALNWSK